MKKIARERMNGGVARMREYRSWAAINRPGTKFELPPRGGPSDITAASRDARATDRTWRALGTMLAVYGIVWLATMAALLVLDWVLRNNARWP
jgi:hypothetical protein